MTKVLKVKPQIFSVSGLLGLFLVLKGKLPLDNDSLRPIKPLEKQ